MVYLRLCCPNMSLKMIEELIESKRKNDADLLYRLTVATLRKMFDTHLYSEKRRAKFRQVK